MAAVPRLLLLHMLYSTANFYYIQSQTSSGTSKHILLLRTQRNDDHPFQSIIKLILGINCKNLTFGFAKQNTDKLYLYMFEKL